MNGISVIVTCKGRLHHLKQTLPLLVDAGPEEIIVVDYDCPDGTADWVEGEYSSVSTIRVKNERHFSLSRARNIGARAARQEWLCFIDADIKVQRGFFSWFESVGHPRCFYRIWGNQTDVHKELWGTCFISKEAFKKIRGYDETFGGWGGEDVDFYDRLKMANYAEDSLAADYLEVIFHGDDERTAFHKIKDRLTQVYINRLYRTAKKQVMLTLANFSELPEETKKKLYRKAENAVLSWIRRNRQPPLPSIELNIIGKSALPSPYLLENEVSLKLSVKQRNRKPQKQK